MDTDISTDVIWENICSRFLIFDIPVNTPMEELAEEIQGKNDLDVVEMRRFLKQNSVEEHVGPCQGPEKCINCKGPHNAKSNSCPAYIKEKKILELKCWNHITTSEAQRVFQLQNMKYSEAVKSSPASVELQEAVNLKFEALLQSINEKFESLLQSVNEKFEKQTAIFAEILHQTIESIMQNMYKIIVQSLETTTSPTRKKKTTEKFGS
ncbi:hypothetical protein AVEN_192988-1 [Araneus ventricosus]|uniref:Uncharacterized protein n=1 Tax=Araneus ventricosus TaxID=182803 RepID=A0A4Y2PUF0_ARAVE|nr:hypothetical protein AVEN_192988-1 [Araneus ventricosus]